MALRPALFDVVVFAGIAAAIAACPKDGTQGSNVPTWEGEAPDGDDALAAHDPPASDTDGITDEGAPGAATPAEPTTGGETSPTPADPSTGEAPDATGDPVEPTPDPAVDPAPAVEAAALPKALHTKIDASCGKDEGLGTKLKPFDLKTVDGKSTTNKSLRGRVSLVNFWGTWCKPCLKELPEFDQLYRRYRKHGMTLVAIATDEDPTPVKEYIGKRKLAAKVLIGAEDYAGEYGSPKFPFTFVVDEKGVIRGSYRGYRPECMGKLEQDLRKQLEARATK